MKVFVRLFERENWEPDRHAFDQVALHDVVIFNRTHATCRERFQCTKDCSEPMGKSESVNIRSKIACIRLK